MVREWCVLYIFTWKCASRHNGVQFFITHLASWLRTRRFSEPTFRPSGATNHWKNTVFRDFPTFSRICIFFLLTLSLLLFFLLIFLFSLPLPCSAFHLSILSEVWLLNFLRLIVKNWKFPVLSPGINLHGQQQQQPCGAANGEAAGEVWRRAKQNQQMKRQGAEDLRKRVRKPCMLYTAHIYIYTYIYIYIHVWVHIYINI